MTEPPQQPSGVAAFTLGYRPSFDGIRGIGVLMVVFAHSLSERFFPASLMALETFFVLSGFLITVLLVREWERRGSIGLRNFYLRRALRLMPGLVFFLAVSCVVIALMDRPGLNDHLREAFAALFYFYNWALIYGWIAPPHLIGYCWSLSVEEQFYLVWPLALTGLLLLRIPRPAKLALVAVAGASAIVMRGVLNDRPELTTRIFLGSDMHADGLLLGCGIGLAACWGMLPRSRRALTVVNLLGLCALPLLAWHTMQYEQWTQLVLSAWWQLFRMAAIGCMLVVVATASSRWTLRLLESPLLVWFGRRSYGIYVWNSAITFYGVSAIVGGALTPLQTRYFSAVVAVAVAAASFRWIETPFLLLKTRFSSEPAASATVHVQTSAGEIPTVAGEDAVNAPAHSRGDAA